MSLLNIIFKKDKDGAVVASKGSEKCKDEKKTTLTSSQKKSEKVSGSAVIKKTEIVKTGKVKESKVVKVSKDDTKDAYKILISPLVSEKSAEGGNVGKYVFKVGINANKSEIRKAIFAVYGITPVNVNTIQNRGKKVRSGRSYGKRKDWKKAIVTLPKGKTIQIYEGT